MIISNQKQQIEVTGQDTSKKAKISQDQLGKLQYLLTKGLYKDPVTAVVAEWANNGIDSVVQAGKDPIKHPVIVILDRNSKGQFYLSVEDKGTGLDQDDFENICMNYLTSTKENDNSTIGHFGIGMKSFLALERAATFTCRKAGKERVYLVYEGSEFVNYDLISEKDTKEEDGVKAELIIKDWSEYSNFKDKARIKLAYYDTVILTIDKNIWPTKIFRNDLFQWSTSVAHQTMHLCLKDVYYIIDYDALGISPIQLPIALRFSLDDGITPTPSRESYITNDNTKKLILKRLSEVADWFFGKYNTTVKTLDTFKEAYPHIGQANHRVDLDAGGIPKSFVIDPLVPYLTIPIEKLKIKGVSLKPLEEYKQRSVDLFYEWDIAAIIGGWNNKYKTKTSGHYIHGLFFRDGYKTVLVSQTPVGNVREFLKSKYPTQVVFITKQRDRMLRDKSLLFTDYYTLLGLNSIPKKDWRAHIKEWDFIRDQLASTFIDETGVQNTKEFIKWVENKKEAQRQARKLGLKPAGYNAIDKKSGDVTIAYPRKAKWTEDGVFEKKAYKIDKLGENKFLTVLFTEAEKQKANEYFMMSARKEVQFALVGSLEIRKIPTHYQFIKYKDFMLDSKPFKRLASSILFNKVIEEYTELKQGKEGIFTRCMQLVEKDYKVLADYVFKNLKNIGDIDDTVSDYIIAVAEEKELYDKELWPEYLRIKEAVKRFDFITCLKEPNSWDNEEIRKYNRHINQMLLFRKKFYDDLGEGAEIVIRKVEPAVKPDPEEEEEEEEGELELETAYQNRFKAI